MIRGTVPAAETGQPQKGPEYPAGYIPADGGQLTTLGGAALRVTEMGATRVAALRCCGVR